MPEFLLAVLPELFLSFAACAVLLLGTSKSSVAQSATRVVALVALALTAGLVAMLPVWFPRPELFQSGILIGGMAVYVKYLALLVTALTILGGQPVRLSFRGDYFGMLLFSAAGLMLVGSATDLVTLYFALELVSLPIYIVVTLSRESTESHEAGTKYFFIGALSAALMAYGMAMIYGAVGTTILADMPPIISKIMTGQIEGYSTLMLGMLIAIIGISFKLAAFPFQYYAPDVYAGTHPAVTGFIGFMPKAAGMVALILLLAPFGSRLPGPLSTAIMVIAVVTMCYGNFVALVQENIKRMMAYSGMAHSGYMMLGLLIGPGPESGGFFSNGHAAILFYLGGYGIMNLGLMAVLSYLRRSNDTGRDLDDVAGLWSRSPLAALTVVVCGLSLLGVPPTIGFFGKLALFGGLLAAPDLQNVGWLLLLIAVLNSAMSAGYYLRITSACYMREPLDDITVCNCGMQRASLIGCCALVLLLGVGFSRLYQLSSHGSHVMIDLASARQIEQLRKLEAAR